MTSHPPPQDLLPRLQDRVQRILTDSPRCHDWDHTLRVWTNARRLAAVEGAATTVVDCAALLHDIGRAREMAESGRSCHAALGASQVPDILQELGVTDGSFIRHVADCVATHRYRSRDGNAPATLEAKVVYDADKLDAIGAIGIGRAFHFAGRVGARVHNSAEEARNSDPYSLEDTAYREYLVKLKHLHNAMLTPEGKRMAQARHAYMQEFFSRLENEVAEVPGSGH